MRKEFMKLLQNAVDEFHSKSVILRPIAQMAELVDASDSKSGVRKDVQVRFLFWAQPHHPNEVFSFSRT